MDFGVADRMQMDTQIERDPAHRAILSHKTNATLRANVLPGEKKLNATL